MVRHLNGRARVVGDNINTDYIIASTRKRDTLDERVLKQYLLETMDPGFAASVRPGDVLVAGRNFGCGSAMEIAATVILTAGIEAVIAPSFARTFFRNAVNNGLLPIQCETTSIREGDAISIQITESVVVVHASSGVTLTGLRVPDFMLEILDAGGLAPFLREHGRFPALP